MTVLEENVENFKKGFLSAAVNTQSLIFSSNITFSAQFSWISRNCIPSFSIFVTFEKSQRISLPYSKSCVLACKKCVCATLFRPKLHELNSVKYFLQVTPNFFFKKWVWSTFGNLWRGNDRPFPGSKERLRAFLITRILD